MNNNCLIIISLAATLSSVMAIECNFIKSPAAQPDLINSFNSINSRYVRTRRSNYEVPFECEENLPQDNNNTYVPVNVGSRNQFEEEDEVCLSTTKALIPKELNNVYNKLIKVYQNQLFVQTIYITECTNPKSDCSNNGYVMAGQKVICRQHYVRITLMAESDSKKTYNEEFYYPSACSCQTVTLKKKQ